MKNLKIAKNCPPVLLIQHVSDDYDYTQYRTKHLAWSQHEVSEEWVRVSMEEGGKSLQKCQNEFFETLHEYPRNILIDLVQERYTWPVDFGYVIRGDKDE